MSHTIYIYIVLAFRQLAPCGGGVLHAWINSTVHIPDLTLQLGLWCLLVGDIQLW